jgi:hypothetical protein
MCNQNIISNKFDLKLVTTFSSYWCTAIFAKSCSLHYILKKQSKSTLKNDNTEEGTTLSEETTFGTWTIGKSRKQCLKKKRYTSTTPKPMTILKKGRRFQKKRHLAPLSSAETEKRCFEKNDMKKWRQTNDAHGSQTAARIWQTTEVKIRE